MNFRQFISRFAAFHLALAAISAAHAGDNWPQFRGPTGQGISDSTGLPATWSETENVVWKTPIPGRGWSSPVILGSQIWLTTALDDGHSLRAICVDRDSGHLTHDIEVFHVDEPAHLNPKNSFASPTPMIEPHRVYVHYGTMGTACLSTDAAEVLWTNRDLPVNHVHGPASSPLIYGNLLIVTCDGIDVQFVAALDKLTGHVVWKTDRSGPLHSNTDRRKAYATPLLIRSGGREQLISPAANQVIAYEPATGRELWKVAYSGYSNVPRPAFGDGLLFIGTGFDAPELWAIHPDGAGDVTKTHVAWKLTKEAPADPSPLVVGDELYVVSDKGIATCLDAKTGDVLWRHRLGGNFSASPIWADGRIFFFSESGDTTVVQPGREYKELAVNRLEGTIMATPAIVDRAFYIRTDANLYRIEGK